MILFFALVFHFSHAADFPVCEDLFSELDAVVENPSADVDAAKKKLFKIANDKRTEVVRAVRAAKNELRNRKDAELKEFDRVQKMNPATSAESKKIERGARKTLLEKFNTEKKLTDLTLAEKEKSCHKYLAERREYYLAKFRDIQRALKQTPKKITEKPLIPNLESEFDTIPKGPGIVLKPQ